MTYSRIPSVRALRVLLVLAILAIGSSSALAAKQQPLRLVFQGGITHQYELVEQQSISDTDTWHNYGSEGVVCDLDPVPEVVVCNRTVDPLYDGPNRGQRCMWDVDDHTGIAFLGDYIRPKTTISLVKCAIFGPGWVYGLGQDPDLGLRLTITVHIRGELHRSVSTTGPALCLGGPRLRDTSPLHEPIPDSDGGFGAPGTVTWSVTNETNRTIRWSRAAPLVGGSGNLGYEPQDSRWCPSGFPLFNTGETSGWLPDESRYWWSIE